MTVLLVPQMNQSWAWAKGKTPPWEVIVPGSPGNNITPSVFANGIWDDTAIWNDADIWKDTV